MTNHKIAVAMSGGVDSSVAAALMVRKYGRENVFGVTMRLFCYGDTEAGEKSCCSVEAVSDAKTVCNQLGIPHYALNMEREFERTVIKNFTREYSRGRTPIPCVLCNTVVKFENLQKRVQGLGADFLVTGHYAKIKKTKNSYKLFRGEDPLKDQSYFLYGLGQEQLARTLFPLADLKKSQVRSLANNFGLKTAHKKESQGICFVTEGRVTDWLADKIKILPGKIVDTSGKVIGEHNGIIFFTVGQRKRIGGGHTEPMYVIRIDAQKNEVIIGTEKELYRKELKYISASWVSGISPKMPLECSAKIRYNMTDQKCVVLPGGKVEFKTAQRAITPGQSVVFYNKKEVLGGGIIEK